MTVSLPRNESKFPIFYNIWVKYISYAFFKCYMEMARKCYNIIYNFPQTEFSFTQIFAFFLRKGQIEMN